MLHTRVHEVSCDCTKKEFDSFREKGIVNLCVYIDVSDKEKIQKFKDLGFIKTDYIENKFGKNHHAYYMEYRGE